MPGRTINVTEAWSSWFAETIIRYWYCVRLSLCDLAPAGSSVRLVLSRDCTQSCVRPLLPWSPRIPVCVPGCLLIERQRHSSNIGLITTFAMLLARRPA